MILWCQIQYGQKVSQNPIIHESEERACESKKMPERGACMIMGWMMIEKKRAKTEGQKLLFIMNRGNET